MAAGKQLPRPRLIKGHGASRKIYIVTHGREDDGLPLYPTRKYLANEDFETVLAELDLPDLGLRVKLGSIARHVEEALIDGHPFDAAAIRGLLDDPDVKAWMQGMDDQGLLPVMR